jgi:hypothetical protein
MKPIWKPKSVKIPAGHERVPQNPFVGLCIAFGPKLIYILK